MRSFLFFVKQDRCKNNTNVHKQVQQVKSKTTVSYNTKHLIYYNSFQMTSPSHLSLLQISCSAVCVSSQPHKSFSQYDDDRRSLKVSLLTTLCRPSTSVIPEDLTAPERGRLHTNSIMIKGNLHKKRETVSGGLSVKQ